MIFYLGVHEPSWMPKARVPLFVSRNRLSRLNGYSLPRASERWALDSGGFSEISKHGRWTIKPRAYAHEVLRYQERIGRLDWAAVQDWMCEPPMLAKTGKSVAEHQARTIASYYELRGIAEEAPWAPVLQGWTLEDYLTHVEAYDRSGLDWASVPVVGVGTMCRRQAEEEALVILDALSKAVRARGGRGVHAFGFKARGIELAAARGIELASADSMAWSLQARKNPPMEGCRHPRCSNCLRFALAWRERVLSRMERAK